ncbi:hypothetical protein [Acinetobacter venetianus]|uniref:hypothetical protein n=1 Tax=Acinetobacter venetianus TaxID=52133 RepID=UPI00215065A6|nr:hypothetical protein [Acinetobacter venetianus]MCR4529847.1 hypothetical protein [Acinetobacter venetianus]
MIDIFLEMHWSNNPIPLDQLKSDPDFILDIPLGLFTSLESPVKSVNGLVGNVVLNAEDVGADPVGVAQAVLEMLDNQKLDKIDYVQHFRGLFSSYAALTAALPIALDGDYAHIDSGSGFDRMSAIFDSDDGKWIVNAVVNVGSNTDEVPEGSSNLYFTSERVRQTTLMGLDLSDSNAVVTTDAILVAIGKLQSQINEIGSDVWNWIHYSDVGIFGSCFAEYFINEVGGLYFCIKDNVLYVKGLVTVTTSSSSIQNIFVFQNPAYHILKPDTLNTEIQYFTAHRINLGLTGSLLYQYVKSGVTYALKTTSSITAGHVFQILPTALCYVN